MGMQNETHAFTLLGVLVLVIVIGLAAFLLMPSLTICREDPQKAICRSHLKQLGTAASMYSNDYRGFYPTCGLGLTVGRDNLRGLGSLCLLYGPYVSDKRIFRCPATKDDPDSPTVGLDVDPVWGLVTARPSGCSYAYDSQKAGLGRRKLPASVLTGVPIMADKPHPQNRLRNSVNHGNAGQNVLYFDGHLEWGPTRYVGLNNEDIYNAATPAGVLSYTDTYVTQ